MSVGEWLNSVVPDGDEYERRRRVDVHGERWDERRRPSPDYDEDDRAGDWAPRGRRGPRAMDRESQGRRDHAEWEEAQVRRDGGPYRDDERGEREVRKRNRSDYRRDRGENSRRARGHFFEREIARAREEIRDTARDEAHREAAKAREGLDEVHDRLDRLSQQLERLAHAAVKRASPPRYVASPPTTDERSEQPGSPSPPLTGAPPQRRRVLPQDGLSIEQAVAEITARQRALDSEPGAAMGRAPRASEPPAAPADASIAAAARAPAADFNKLESQLRQITVKIDALQTESGIEKAIAAVRGDLADIGRQLTEALPRHAIELLEIEVKALAERIDHSRQSGGDPNALTGLEQALTEVREALHRLTPAENLVGFEEAVNALAQKVDLILAREDPTALQQLEAAIGGLRGVVSHVASNDTLARVAEDVPRARRTGGQHRQ